MNLLTMSPAEFCTATRACAEGREFARQYDKMADVWEHCPKSDWLLWITDKLDQRPDDRTLRLFAVWCARNTPLDDGRVTGDLLTDPRSIAAIDVAERYANSMATREEMAAAGAAAGAAAWAAAWGAAGAAAEATQAAAWAAACAAGGAARAAQATQFRRMVPNPFRSKEAQP